MSYARAALALALAFATGAAPAQIYRWTDEKGRVQLSDTPPPGGAPNVEKRAPASVAPDAAGEPYALQLARRNAPIKLYSTPRCQLCDQARGLLNARGVPFKEVSVVSEKQLEELKKVVGGDAVPSLIVGSTVQRGFEELTYQGILDAAGYPKTGVVQARSQKEPEPQFERLGERKAQTADDALRGPYAPRVGPSHNR
jgi:glutaredoxin